MNGTKMPAGPARKAEVTRLLQEWRQGSPEAVDRLLALVYDELRRMARLRLLSERRHSLQATELVHEAFVRLVDQKAEWQNRSHFYGIAARCMRRILIDHARKKRAAKRPPAAGAVDLDHADLGESSSVETLLALDQALERVAAQSPRQARVAELKLFGGLDISEIAQVVGVSAATVKRDWADAKELLSESMTESPRDSP